MKKCESEWVKFIDELNSLILNDFKDLSLNNLKKYDHNDEFKLFI